MLPKRGCNLYSARFHWDQPRFRCSARGWLGYRALRPWGSLGPSIASSASAFSGGARGGGHSGTELSGAAGAGGPPGAAGALGRVGSALRVPGGESPWTSARAGRAGRGAGRGSEARGPALFARHTSFGFIAFVQHPIV